MLDWNDLRYAIAVAEARTLTAAAKRLRVNQTTVGRRIAALEAALGVKLFLRDPRGLLPTAAGVRLLDSVGGLAAALATLESSVRDDASSVSGRVRVATTEVNAQHLLDETLPRLRRAHPGLCVELVTANAVADVGMGEVDLAVRFVKPEGAALLARRLGTMRYGLFASRAYLARRGAPASPGDLAGHDVVWPCRELERGPEAAYLAAHATGARASFRSNSMPALRRAAAEGLGLAVLPLPMEAGAPPLERLFVLESAGTRSVYLVQHRDARALARVKAVADAVSEDLRARLAGDVTP